MRINVIDYGSNLNSYGLCENLIKLKVKMNFLTYYNSKEVFNWMENLT